MGDPLGMGPQPSLAQSQFICPVACCLKLCTCFNPPARVGAGEKHPGWRERFQPSREPALAGSLRNPVPLHDSQPGGFIDQVTEVRSGPKSHSIARPKTRLPDSQSLLLPIACSSPLSPETPVEQEWRRDSG